MPDELPVILFKNKSELSGWLEINNSKTSGVWIRISKKNSGIKSVSYAEAVESALCYGWIDGQVKKYDEYTYMQRFTPRRNKSIWSKINKQKALKLIKEGKMKPSGLEAIKAAKKNGFWENAYEPQSQIKEPPDLLKALDKNIEANRFYKTINRVNRYAILHRIQKTGTKEKRMSLIKKFINMLEENRKLY
jgi:uncharacterized protein YdeI (YjbR/CyaY-like superfamily)